MLTAIHLLGVPHVVRDDRPVQPPRGQKAWGLLAYLLLAGRPVSRAHLAGLLFADANDPLGALRWNLSELRRSLGDTLRGDALTLDETLEGGADVRILTHGGRAAALSLPGLDRELLEGMSFLSSPGFDVWLGAQRRHLRALADGVLREAATERLAAGASAEAAALAARLVARDPLDEGGQVLLVRALVASGDAAAAARQAADCRAVFRRELGVAPGPALDEALCAMPPQVPPRSRDEEGALVLYEGLEPGETNAPELDEAASRGMGYIDFLRGRYDCAVSWLARAMPLAGRAPLEHARILTVHGSVLTDTAHYAEAESLLRHAVDLSDRGRDMRQLAYAVSMLGRVLLLRGDLHGAARQIERSLAIAQQKWPVFVPWPLAMRAEVQLLQGDAEGASEQFERAFALGCQIGNPCWEGLAGHGLGLSAGAAGDVPRAVALLEDAAERSRRLQDACVWVRAHMLELLARIRAQNALPQMGAWVHELQQAAAHTVRTQLHLSWAKARAAQSGGGSP
jgi:DNA-binding SARP family transcriptional activator